VRLLLDETDVNVRSVKSLVENDFGMCCSSSISMLARKEDMTAGFVVAAAVLVLCVLF
jgi:hypothetical protein